MAWTNPRAPRYPKSITVQVSTEVAEKLEQLAGEKDLTRAEVIRVLIHASLRRAGHAVATRDQREPRLADLAAEPEDRRRGGVTE